MQCFIVVRRGWPCTSRGGEGGGREGRRGRGGGERVYNDGVSHTLSEKPQSTKRGPLADTSNTNEVGWKATYERWRYASIQRQGRKLHAACSHRLRWPIGKRQWPLGVHLFLFSPPPPPLSLLLLLFLLPLPTLVKHTCNRSLMIVCDLLLVSAWKRAHTHTHTRTHPYTLTHPHTPWKLLSIGNAPVTNMAAACWEIPHPAAPSKAIHGAIDWFLIMANSKNRSPVYHPLLQSATTPYTPSSSSSSSASSRFYYHIFFPPYFVFPFCPFIIAIGFSSCLFSCVFSLLITDQSFV